MSSATDATAMTKATAENTDSSSTAAAASSNTANTVTPTTESTRPTRIKKMKSFDFYEEPTSTRRKKREYSSVQDDNTTYQEDALNIDNDDILLNSKKSRGRPSLIPTQLSVPPIPVIPIKSVKSMYRNSSHGSASSLLPPSKISRAMKSSNFIPPLVVYTGPKNKTNFMGTGNINLDSRNTNSSSKSSSSDSKNDHASSIEDSFANNILGDVLNEKTKGGRPSVSAAAKKIFSKLLTSDPMNMTDLQKANMDIPRDIIQAVLDVFRVLGIVQQYKVIDNSTVSSPADVSVYSICGFSKSYKVIDLSKIKDDTDQLIKSKLDTYARLKELQELSLKTMSRAERLAAMKGLIKRFKATTPNLGSNALYQAFINAV